MLNCSFGNLGKLFQRVADIKRGEVIAWLCCKYTNLEREDLEDIVQDSSIVLWDLLLANKVANAEGDLLKMWKTISRNKCTHWIEKQKHKVKWDARLLNGWDEGYDAWNRGDEEHRYKMEMMHEWIDRQSDKNRLLMQMVFEDKSMSDICKALGLKSDQNARNKKCNLIKRMKKELNNGQTYAACPLSICEVA